MPTARAIAALLLAAVAALVAWPSGAAPWNAATHAFLLRSLGWAGLPIAVGAALLAAAALMPRARDGLASPPRRDLAPLGVGLLFVLEPFLRLASLAVAAWAPHAGALDAVLPRPPGVEAGLPALALRVAVLSLWAPLAEEAFFRGRLLPWLAARLDAREAVMLSAAAFAAAHGGVDQWLVAAPLGLLLGTLRVRGAPLSACVLVHATHNALILIAGGAAARPPAALALIGGGIVLIAFARACRPGASPRRCAGVAAVATAALLALWPGLRAAHTRLWAAAAPRVAASPRVGDAAVASRLDAWVRAGAPGAEALDGAGLAAIAWPSEARRLCALACCAPDRALAIADDPDATYEALETLARARLPCAATDALARALAARQPEAFAQAMLACPDALARWLPLPDGDGGALAQLRRTEAARHRRLLLTTWERAFPGRTADLVLALPAADVTGIERQHLRRCYDDAAARIAARVGADAALAAAWNGEAAADD